MWVFYNGIRHDTHHTRTRAELHVPTILQVRMAMMQHVLWKKLGRKVGDVTRMSRRRHRELGEPAKVQRQTKTIQMCDKRYLPLLMVEELVEWVLEKYWDVQKNGNRETWPTCGSRHSISQRLRQWLRAPQLHSRLPIFISESGCPIGITAHRVQSVDKKMTSKWRNHPKIEPIDIENNLSWEDTLMKSLIAVSSLIPSG